MAKINKKSKFNQTFKDPVCFGEDFGTVVSAEIFPTKEDARKAYDDVYGDEVDPNPSEGLNVRSELIRFGFPPEDLRLEIGEYPGVPIWHGPTYAGHGAKSVWVIGGRS